MGKKLTIYLIEGTDSGARTIDIGNWSGKAIHSPRAGLLEILKRDEYDNPGVYILKSDAEGEIYSERVYIGEAENIRSRLKQHLSTSKDFNECIVFISTDDLLTKSHIKYIESKLIDLAVQLKNAEIENTNKPPKNTLSEADISDMEYYIKQIKLVLPVAGYNFLISKRSNKINNELNDENLFRIRGKKVSAKMKETIDGFIVLSGSQASIAESPSLSKGWRNLRKRLIDNKTLYLDKNYYIFSEDTIFNSVSAASSIILGRQSAGPLDWLDNNGQNYKDYLTNKIQNE